MRAKQYAAKARLVDDVWIVRVEGVGPTQALTRADVETMARDLIVCMEEVEEADIDLTVEYAPPGDR